MDKRKQLDHWKRLFVDWEKREEEIGAALTGERVYLFDLLLYAEDAVRDLYDMDDSDWNNYLIYNYLTESVDYDTFKSYIVINGGCYDGLCSKSSRGETFYWREPYLVVNNTEVDSHEDK